MTKATTAKILPLSDEAPIKSRGITIPHIAEMTRRHRTLLSENKYDGNLVGALNRLLNTDDKVLELGTGFGFTAAFMAAKKGVSVVSYDANPDILPPAQQLLDANGIKSVSLHHGAFGPRKGSKPVDVFVRKDLMASSLGPLDDEPEDAVAAKSSTDVLNTNTVFKAHRPSVFVSSSEGGEVAALAAADLSALRAAVIVLNPLNTGSSGIATVFGAMERSGLIYYPRLSKGKLVVFHKGA
ncbi:hypothetical protein [Algirhabdus cladophorae]|uniref:hypothetical protein n=1 Tax=Algirhabdus cladophorae TaxID=3377108 RepID=UPI003B84B24A